VKIGNFVEVKNARVGDGTAVSHLAYVGDCDIGAGCNIGCGAIFVNYDGKTKHRTTVEDNCFIGSNCNIIAPVHIAKNSYICAGTTVTKDTQNLDFVIGRVEPTVKSGRAKGYLKEVK
jgi:bifunctional UDP-N-acetylglucosamine pyrophosphorylase/glucosamine-1-phosphate N-acetyltransferase